MINSLKELFWKVWTSRYHQCEVCGTFIYESKTFCFAHVLGHGMHKKYKYDPNNIIMVCSIECHREVDRLTSGNKHVIESMLAEGNQITFDYLLNLNSQR